MAKVKFEVDKSDDGYWTVHCKGEGIFQTGSKPQAEKVKKLMQRKYDIEDELRDIKAEINNLRTFSPGWMTGW